MERTPRITGLATLLSCALLAHGQPAIEWQKCLGGSGTDRAHSIQQTTDGGYIVAGSSTSNDGDVSDCHGEGNAWVVKLDGSGNVQWQKCLGEAVHSYSIQQTIDGGYIVTGHTDDGGYHGGQADYWVAKLDGSGNVQWQRSLGGSSSDWAWSIQQTTDGGCILAGYSRSNDRDVSGNHGDYDMWVAKLDGNGNIQWQKCLGGSRWDKAYSIQQTSDDGYIVAGFTASNDGDVSGNHGDYDMWVVKLDDSGAVQWQKCLGGSGRDEAYSIQQTNDGGYIVAGFTTSNDGDVSGYHGGWDFWVVKLDDSGDIQWQKCLGGSGEDLAYSIQQTIDHGYIVAGSTRSNDCEVSGYPGLNDYWVVKLDSSGNIQWQKCMGGSGLDSARSIQQTTDGGYIVVGETLSSDGDVSGNHGNRGVWVVKLAPE